MHGHHVHALTTNKYNIIHGMFVYVVGPWGDCPFAEVDPSQHLRGFPCMVWEPHTAHATTLYIRGLLIEAKPQIGVLTEVKQLQQAWYIQCKLNTV